MKKLIEIGSNVLPYVLLIALGSWVTYGWMSARNEIDNQKWEIATLQKDLDYALYSLEQEKKWQKEREEFRKELDKQFKDFDSKLLSYTKPLKVIKDERNKSGVNNSLSPDVSRVLKDFNQGKN